MAQGTAQNLISLMIGHPDPATLSTPELEAAVESVMHSSRLRSALQYGPEQGTPGLRQYLVDKFNREQRLSVSLRNVMLIAGSTHAVDMIARLYAAPDQVVLVEAPTYADALHIFRDHHIELCPIPMDEHGLIPAVLESQLEQLRFVGKQPAFLYTIPNFHNPTGTTLPLERRVEIVRLARQYKLLIVEDDVYRDLYFGQPPPATFYALADGQGVFSIGSFSKTLSPGLRLGWLVSDEAAIGRCVECGTTQMGGGANPFTAHIVGEYCARGYWEAHIERLRVNYKQRRDILLAALARYMPAEVTWTQPDGGFFVWLRLPKDIFAPQVKRAALEQGVSLASGEGFFINTADGEHNLRLAYSFAPLTDIEKGIQLLSGVI